MGEHSEQVRRFRVRRFSLEHLSVDRLRFGQTAGAVVVECGIEESGGARHGARDRSVRRPIRVPTPPWAGSPEFLLDVSREMVLIVLASGTVPAANQVLPRGCNHRERGQTFSGGST